MIIHLTTYFSTCPLMPCKISACSLINPGNKSLIITSSIDSNQKQPFLDFLHNTCSWKFHKKQLQAYSFIKKNPPVQVFYSIFFTEQFQTTTSISYHITSNFQPIAIELSFNFFGHNISCYSWKISMKFSSSLNICINKLIT